jgi:hypothetical protein
MRQCDGVNGAVERAVAAPVQAMANGAAAPRRRLRCGLRRGERPVLFRPRHDGYGDHLTNRAAKSGIDAGELDDAVQVYQAQGSLRWNDAPNTTGTRSGSGSPTGWQQRLSLRTSSGAPRQRRHHTNRAARVGRARSPGHSRPAQQRTVHPRWASRARRALADGIPHRRPPTRRRRHPRTPHPRAAGSPRPPGDLPLAPARPVTLNPGPTGPRGGHRPPALDLTARGVLPTEPGPPRRRTRWARIWGGRGC